MTMNMTRMTFLLLICSLVIAGCRQKDRADSAKGDEQKVQVIADSSKVQFFDWQFPSKTKEERWTEFMYDQEKWWGTFPKDQAYDSANYTLPEWAIGPFKKYEGNPVLKPTPGKWDQGRFGGGVHNGSVIIRDDKFYYVYRGEQPIDIPTESRVDYICDIGIAVSEDGRHFRKLDDYSPFFRKGRDRKYSYEDVNIARHGDTYYMFCNQWDWEQHDNTSVSGAFLATSKDLFHWEKHGIIFPDAEETHRNPVVLQNPHNEAIRAANGKFVMYLNRGIIAYSDDLMHWESRKVKEQWPGGEGCFALTGHSDTHPDHIVLFTGGHHTGHFYAIGEVLLSRNDPEKAIDWLPRPIIHAETGIPHEFGLSAEEPHRPVSEFRDCIFFNALTRYDSKWWMYYGGSEYYTCLATAPAGRSYGP
jgi:predicted GH43/DUF377 family glycosyl hydrolase